MARYPPDALGSYGSQSLRDAPHSTEPTHAEGPREGSTRLREDNPDAWHDALTRHDEIIRVAIESLAGQVVKTTDGFHAAFATARNAIDAAVVGELTLDAEQWGVTGPLAWCV